MPIFFLSPRLAPAMVRRFSAKFRWFGLGFAAPLPIVREKSVPMTATGQSKLLTRQLIRTPRAARQQEDAGIRNADLVADPISMRQNRNSVSRQSHSNTFWRDSDLILIYIRLRFGSPASDVTSLRFRRTQRDAWLPPRTGAPLRGAG
jgi:hypothetical protein